MNIVKAITDRRNAPLISQVEENFERFKQFHKRYGTFRNDLSSELASLYTKLDKFCAAIPKVKKEAETEAVVSAAFYTSLLQIVPLTKQAIEKITREVASLEKERAGELLRKIRTLWERRNYDTYDENDAVRASKEWREAKSLWRQVEKLGLEHVVISLDSNGCAKWLSEDEAAAEQYWQKEIAAAKQRRLEREAAKEKQRQEEAAAAKQRRLEQEAAEEKQRQEEAATAAAAKIRKTVFSILYWLVAAVLAGGVFMLVSHILLQTDPTLSHKWGMNRPPGDIDAIKVTHIFIFGAICAIIGAIIGWRIMEDNDVSESTCIGAIGFGILMGIPVWFWMGIGYAIISAIIGAIIGAIGGAIIGAIGKNFDIGGALVGGILGLIVGALVGGLFGYYVIGAIVQSIIGTAITPAILLLIGTGILYIALYDMDKPTGLIAAAVIMAAIGIPLFFSYGGPGVVVSSYAAQARAEQILTDAKLSEDGTVKTMRITSDPNKLKYITSEKRYETLGLRSEPKANADRLAGLSRGDIVTILQEGSAATIEGMESNWVEVEVRTGAHTGQKGWLFKGYLDE